MDIRAQIKQVRGNSLKEPRRESANKSFFKYSKGLREPQAEFFIPYGSVSLRNSLIQLEPRATRDYYRGIWNLPPNIKSLSMYGLALTVRRSKQRTDKITKYLIFFTVTSSSNKLQFLRLCVMPQKN